MYAHVTTYRLGDSEETAEDVANAAETLVPISDQTARTLASYWHSPADGSRNITRLSHGLPFDTEELAAEIGREVTEPADAEALLSWLSALEALLSA